ICKGYYAQNARDSVFIPENQVKYKSTRGSEWYGQRTQHAVDNAYEQSFGEIKTLHFCGTIHIYGCIKDKLNK
ncbi:9425_t:CDS:1, partial [Paraglomus brasilianum]